MKFCGVLWEFTKLSPTKSLENTLEIWTFLSIHALDATCNPERYTLKKKKKKKIRNKISRVWKKKSKTAYFHWIPEKKSPFSFKRSQVREIMIHPEASMKWWTFLYESKSKDQMLTPWRRVACTYMPWLLWTK